MSSSTFIKALVASSDKIVHRTDSWSQIAISLDSAAGGVTTWGFSSSNKAILVPGAPPVVLLVAPDTDVYVDTTALVAVRVDVHVTDRLPQMEGLDDLSECIQKLGELIAFIHADVIEAKKHQLGAGGRGSSLTEREREALARSSLGTGTPRPRR
jgi:hypothetical protein